MDGAEDRGCVSDVTARAGFYTEFFHLLTDCAVENAYTTNIFKRETPFSVSLFPLLDANFSNFAVSAKYSLLGYIREIHFRSFFSADDAKYDMSLAMQMGLYTRSTSVAEEGMSDSMHTFRSVGGSGLGGHESTRDISRVNAVINRIQALTKLAQVLIKETDIVTRHLHSGASTMHGTSPHEVDVWMLHTVAGSCLSILAYSDSVFEYMLNFELMDMIGSIFIEEYQTCVQDLLESTQVVLQCPLIPWIWCVQDLIESVQAAQRLA